MFITDSIESGVSDFKLLPGEYDEILHCILDFRHHPRYTGAWRSLPLPSLSSGMIRSSDRFTSYAEKSYREFYLHELTRKLAPFGASSTPEARCTAFSGWLASEERCKQTNNYLFSDATTLYESILWARARELVTRVLGKVPCDLDVVQAARPGPGETYSPSQGRTGMYYKYNSLSHLTITHDAMSFVEPLIGDDELWSRSLGLKGHYGLDRYAELFSKIEIVQGNRLTTVPKNVDTDRCICIEPGLNVMLQLGVGSIIRSRFKRRTGIDLDYQHEEHRKFVLFQWDKICTIDLSSASDTIAYRLVEKLVPPEWFHLLCRLRCAYTKVPGGRWWHNEKFSSMGNGFTFELESLIFWAISKAALDFHRVPRLTPRLSVSVYGDDIICHSDGLGVVGKMLESSGFSLNKLKTFGPDRAMKESCGVFSLNGMEIPVFNLKRLESWPDVLATLNHLFLSKKQMTKVGFISTAGLIQEIHQKIVDLVPISIRNFGPPSGLLNSYIFQEVNLGDFATRKDWRALFRKGKGTKDLTGVDVDLGYKAEKIVREGYVSPHVRLTFYQFEYLLVNGLMPVTRNFREPALDYFGQSVYALRNRRFGGFSRRGVLYRHRTLILNRQDIDD